MSQKFRSETDPEAHSTWAGPSEPECHIEHQAALDATVFREPSRCEELVLELVAGQFRLRPPR